MKNKKWILAAALTIALAAAALIIFLPRNAAPTEAAAEETAQGAETAAEEQEQPLLVQINEDDPAIAYVLVENPSLIGFLPLPTEGEYTKTFRHVMPDGSEWVNIIHVTPQGFYMEKSNCEGQDCIAEGEVTLENRQTRALWNMVICMPHQLVLELATREELLQILGQ